MKSGVPISLRNVSKTFGEDTDKPFRALKQISAEVDAGAFISVVGPSGCGKSTLMLMVAGLLGRSRGEILVAGKPVTKPVTDVGIAFQDHLLLEFRTAMGNVMLQADIRKLPRQAIEARANELFAQLGLTPAIQKYPRQLSGGMRQRVSLVRTLVHDPSLLLMDEPFGALDEMTRERMNDEVLRIWEQTATTVVFVTHSIPEAVYLSSRVVVMSARPGRITKIVDVDLPRPRNDDVRESERYFQLITEVREALRAGGGDLDDAGTASARRTLAGGAVG
jgi:NitT/TauT family transport system ATP-binding protein